jgi:hypothetical protein
MPHSRTLHRLIYASRQNLSPDTATDEVAEIITTSIRNNSRVAVTGLLLVHGGWFLQALEGPYEAVMRTYGRIVSDPRHVDPHVVAAGPAAEREFGDWNMCARHVGVADDAILETLGQRTDFRPAEFTPAAALRLLTAVRGIQQRTEAAAGTRSQA